MINYINIYEDITLPVFMADVEVLDLTDALGRYMISGKEPVSLSLSVPGIDNTINLSLALLQNKNLDDKTEQGSGSMKYKTYIFRMVSQDMLMNQAYKLMKSFNTQTHDIVAEALKTISSATIDTPDPTSSPQRIISNNEYVYDFLHRLQERHVSQQYQSSLYTLFANRMNNNESRTFCTFEYLMSKSSVATFLQDQTMGAQTLTRRNAMINMLWLKVPDSFSTPIAWNAPSVKHVYNHITGTASNILQNVIAATTSAGVILGNPITGGVIDLANRSMNPQMRGNTVDPSNDSQATGIADAKIKRANYIKDLAQNSVQFELNGNPSYTVGQIVTLDIPKKAFTEWEEGEKQMNGQVLITKLRHKINPFATSPRYTMVVEGIKAGYYSSGA